MPSSQCSNHSIVHLQNQSTDSFSLGRYLIIIWLPRAEKLSRFLLAKMEASSSNDHQDEPFRLSI